MKVDMVIYYLTTAFSTIVVSRGSSLKHNLHLSQVYVVTVGSYAQEPHSVQLLHLE
jgi:hypothetical protein